MKKAIVLLTSLLSVSAFAQTNDLYDVNYDAPKNIAVYDENQKVFQQIYLQYENAIKTSEEKIRTDEKNIRQNEVNSVKEAESQKSQAALTEALEKQRQEIYANEIEAVKANERDRLSAEIREAVSAELTEKFTAVYEEKKNNEVSEAEKKLREQISLENENLKAQYKAEVEAELTPKFEEKKNQEIAVLKEQLAKQVYEEQKEKFDKELRSKISLENKKLAEKYKADVKTELTSEYEAKKNAEIAEYKKEWKQEVFEENKIRTERMKFLAPYFATVICVIAALVFIFLLIKLVMKKFAEKKYASSRENNQKQIVEYFSDSYFERMKQYSGKTETIREEIDKSSEPEEIKAVYRKAIGIAQEKYASWKSTLTIADYKKHFKDLDSQNIFDDWNAFASDPETKKGLCNQFIANINGYTETAIDAWHSKNNQSDVENLLLQYAQTLKNTSEQVKNLVNQETNTGIKNTLVSIAQKYEELAKKFAKGDF